MKPAILILVVVLAFAETMLAVDPPPDGGYPNNNTAEGEDALLNLTTGTDNTALGFNALLSNTTGNLNVAVGSQALASNTTGGENIAIGAQALFSNQDGFINLALGHQALYQNISGSQNIAIGDLALYANQSTNNTAVGFFAASLNAPGSFNTAVGYGALYVNQGSNNCAFGANAMGANETSSGSNNTAVGAYALWVQPGKNNTAVGYYAGSLSGSGKNNISIGYFAGSHAGVGDNNIDIGHQGLDHDTGIIRIGKNNSQTNTYIAGINGVTVAGGVGVVIDSQGHLGTLTSSARYKEAIKPMKDASEAVLSLKPVSFRYKKELDPDSIPQFGLVAEDVEKVDPDLVAKDGEGKPYTVRYEAVNAMLLNEFLKEHKKVEEQGSQLTDQTKEIAELKAALKNMSARLDANGL